MLLGIVFFQFTPDPPIVSDEHIMPVKHSDIQSIHLPFIENQGQVDEHVKFYANTFAGTVYVTDENLVYQSLKQNDDSQTLVVINENFVDGTLHPLGIEKHSAIVNYFKGSEDNWKTHIPTYTSVSLGQVWPHVDVSLTAYGNNIEKIFTVSPGGQVSDIKNNIDGIKSLSLSENDELILDTIEGQLLFTTPLAYQIINDVKQTIPVSYEILDSTTYGFNVADYDPRYDLVIDPLIASTYIGGAHHDVPRKIALDSAGDVYAVGYTTDHVSIDFPTIPGSYDTTTNGDRDVFVSKFDSNLTKLKQSTYIGSSSRDEGYGIGFDSSENVYITGHAGASDFPVTGSAYDQVFNVSNEFDGFVAKSNSDLTSLSASTFIGGEGYDHPYSIFLDNFDNVYIVGETEKDATDFPTTPGAYDLIHDGSTVALMDL